VNVQVSGRRVALEGVVLLLAQNQKAVNVQVSGRRVALGWVVVLLAEETTRLELRVQAIALQAC
jgi:hypothetical protein